jgi:hypothetical protein
MLCWVIGWDLAHIGQTLHRVLFEPGYFRVIPDAVTGRWRSFNPANPEDNSRYAESEEAGPMIPERLVIPKTWAWENRAENVFKTVSVRNPWGIVRICAFPSTGIQAKQGDAVDLIWVDEDIRWPQHVKEWQDRLSDRKGRMMWSAWPHGSNDALVEMSERAQEQSALENPDVHEIVLRFSDNPYIDSEEKRKSIDRMRTEEDRRSRDYGEFLLDTIAMYEFVPAVHGVHQIIPEDPFSQQYSGDYLSQMWTREGKFPDNWTRYLAIDPSHTRTAVLFGVVPRPDFDGQDFQGYLIVENELVAKKVSARQLADQIKPLVAGKNYEAFIIDYHMGRQTRVGGGAGDTAMSLYEQAFRETGIKSRLTGHGFLPGSSVRSARHMEVRAMLQPDKNGRVRLRFAMNKTYHTQKEFSTYRKKMMAEEVLDEPANARTHDCMAALEYLTSYVFNTPEPYIAPDSYRTGSPAYRKAQQLLAKWKKGSDQGYCHIGPGGEAA